MKSALVINSLILKTKHLKYRPKLSIIFDWDFYVSMCAEVNIHTKIQSSGTSGKFNNIPFLVLQNLKTLSGENFIILGTDTSTGEYTDES